MTRKINYLPQITLFLLTFLFTLVVGVFNSLGYFQPTLPSDSELLSYLIHNPHFLLWGLPYALSLLFILFVHEMGHFLACRRHHIEATLPYFIPAPTMIGTFGAFIKIRSPFTSKKSLLDIGLAGPISGFLAAIPVICIGIMLSRTIPRDSLPGGMSLGEPLIFQFLTWLIKGPAPANSDILIHPVAFAGWFGLLATTFNLFPVGQLDGGHILYALIGRKSYYAGIVSILVILLLGILFWPGWLIWALLVSIIGLRHPPVYEEEKLDRRSYLWGVAALIIFLLSFTPAPIRGIF